MKFSGPVIVSELRQKLQYAVGRHLYGVLGSYEQLRHFEENDLIHATDGGQRPFPCPINLNRALLESIEDVDLRRLVRDEARYPQAVRGTLNRAVQQVLNRELQKTTFLIVKHIELIFAYGLDLTVFRTSATNQSHILLLLPGERRGQHVALFLDADSRFHQNLPNNLIADNHLWELSNG
jgi:hypothetical protein